MNKTLAIHLIQEQIRNQVLILALEKLGFDCTIYTLNISETILTLIGFSTKTDELYQRYFELIEKAVEETDYCNMDEKLQKWSEVIYSEMQTSTSTNSEMVIPNAWLILYKVDMIGLVLPAS